MSAAYNAAEEIKSRCDIVDVIGRVVPLKKSGSKFWGICPFHNEKTPSFSVSEDKQFYFCFGCGASGDLISFVQNYYQLDFVQAIEQLAREHGITLEVGFQKDTNKEEAYNINKEAAKFFYKALREKNNPGYVYMKQRGITPEIMNKFGIGYADDDFSSLRNHLTAMGFEEKKLLELGLISTSKGNYYDKFRNRVIFPIINAGGKVIGFGGRIIGEGEPKYLNSQESNVFLKKNNLYALNLTRQEIGKQDLAILVEGYMDVIALYQNGVRNVTASLGTALTENQARLIKRYTENIILSYDADEAGIKATIRGLDILYKEDCKVKALQIPNGKDPDGFITGNGKNAFLKLVEEALTLADYKFSLLKKEFDLDSAEGRVDFLKKAVQVLRSLKPVEADVYIKKLAEDIKISPAAIKLELDGSIRQGLTKQKNYTKARRQGDKDDVTPMEKMILKLLLVNSSYCPKIVPYEESIFRDSLKGRRIYECIQRLYKEGEEIDVEKLKDALGGEYGKELTSILENPQLVRREEKVFSDCVKTINLRELESKEEEAYNKLEMAKEEDNEEWIKKLTKEIMEIQEKLNTIRR